MPQYKLSPKDSPSAPLGAIIEAPDVAQAVAQWLEDMIDWAEQVELEIEILEEESS